MSELTAKPFKKGEIIVQQRSPGGNCLLIEIIEDLEEYKTKGKHPQTIWKTNHDFPILQILHPTEGFIEDPSYYYNTVETLEMLREWYSKK